MFVAWYSDTPKWCEGQWVPCETRIQPKPITGEPQTEETQDWSVKQDTVSWRSWSQSIGTFPVPVSIQFFLHQTQSEYKPSWCQLQSTTAQWEYKFDISTVEHKEGSPLWWPDHQGSQVEQHSWVQTESLATAYWEDEWTCHSAHHQWQLQCSSEQGHIHGDTETVNATPREILSSSQLWKQSVTKRHKQ